MSNNESSDYRDRGLAYRVLALEAQVTKLQEIVDRLLINGIPTRNETPATYDAEQDDDAVLTDYRTAYQGGESDQAPE